MMNRLKALYRSWAIPCAGSESTHRAIASSGWTRSANRVCAAGRSSTISNSMRCDALHRQVRHDLLAESRKHPADEVAAPDSFDRSDSSSAAGCADANAASLSHQATAVGLQRVLALKTYSSGEYRFVAGQLQRTKRPVSIRGLNRNHNHDLKNIFKGAAIRAAITAGTFTGVLRRHGGSRNEAGDGAADAGPEDCRDHFAGLEERSVFRR